MSHLPTTYSGSRIQNNSTDVSKWNFSFSNEMQFFEVLYKFTGKFSRLNRQDPAEQIEFQKSSTLYRRVMRAVDLPDLSAK